MGILTIFIIALALSMDAFSLSLLYGTLQFSYKKMLTLATTVGLFHFIMPLFGIYFGNIITKYISTNLVGGFVFLIIGISMIFNSFKKENKIEILSFIQMILFGMAVSIDSFSLGIGLNNFTNNYFLSSLIFCVCSFMFTLIGLLLGKKISNVVGTVATIFGGIVLSSIGLICFIH